jgi:magnesium chelatase family protein
VFLHPPEIQRYMSKISGPLMDRIDIQIDVPAVPYKELATARNTESSDIIRARMISARNRQMNAQMGSRLIRKHCVVTPQRPSAKRSWKTP